MINVKINKDQAGFPSVVEIQGRAGKTSVNFDSEKGLRVVGRFNEEVANVLKLIYPFTEAKTTQALLDSGTLIHRAAGDLVDADVILYTVPVNRVFYLLMTDLDVGFPANFCGGAIWFFDGLVDRNITALATNQAQVWHDHSANSLCLKVPAGYVIHAISWGSAWVNAHIIGVEI